MSEDRLAERLATLETKIDMALQYLREGCASRHATIDKRLEKLETTSRFAANVEWLAYALGKIVVFAVATLGLLRALRGL